MIMSAVSSPLGTPGIALDNPFSEFSLGAADTCKQDDLKRLQKSLESSGSFSEPNLGLPTQAKPKCIKIPTILLADEIVLTPRSHSMFAQVPLPKSVQALDATSTTEIMQFLSPKDSMIVDVRSFKAYSTLRVKNAINICLPSTLLKRSSFDLPHVVNHSNLSQPLKEALVEKDRHFNILIYDQSSENSRISMQLYHTAIKFYEGSDFTVAYLDGGFQAVSDLMKDSTLHIPLRSTLPESSALPKQDKLPELHNSGERTPLVGFTLPSAFSPELKLLNSIKRSVPRIDSRTKYVHNFKFPKNFELKKDKLPGWLLFLSKSYGKQNCSQLIVDHLSERFSRLEASEQVRLSQLINNTKGSIPYSCSVSLHESSGYGTPLELCPCCDDITYKIPKGVEYGYKNRYKNIWPYEHSRVHLKQSPSCRGTGRDDYFNANYISFYELSDNKYIATQNPLESTNEDFWIAVWYNGVQAIVCLDNSSVFSVDKYYERNNEFASLSTHIELVTEHAGYTLRQITIKRNSQERILYHFAYKDWPDFGTPEDLHTVIDMMKLKNKVLALNAQGSSENSWELLVHCSAGCGRTGCFITLDMVSDLLARGSARKRLNPWGNEDLIYKSVQFQRQQRISMVQNLGQYIFCYESVLNYYFENL